jgi:hypothetical protein
MRSGIGTGRWSEVTDEVQPFGMSFVDIVASALICVVALLILFLQFIDPLGHIPGHSARTGTQAQNQIDPGKDGKPSYAMPPLLLSILARWPNETGQDIRVDVGCDSGRSIVMRPTADGYAAATVSVSGLSSAVCSLRAESVGPRQDGVNVSVRAITDGKQLFDASFVADGPAKDVLADPRSEELKKALGEDPGPWPYNWSQGP